MKLRCGICAVLCIALIAGNALGQGERRRGGGGGQGQGGRQGMGGGGLVALAKAKDVAADLKLSEEQTKKLDDLEKSNTEKMRKIREEAGDDRQAAGEKMREMAQQTEKELGGIISADQLKRLKQLQLQSTVKNFGLMFALMNPANQQALSLNDEQKEQLRGFQQDSMEQMRDIGQDREKMTEFRESMNKKVEKLLTDDQKAKLKDLQGEPFKGEFPRPQMGRPRKDGGN